MYSYLAGRNGLQSYQICAYLSPRIIVYGPLKSVSQYAKRCLVGGDVARTHLHQLGNVRPQNQQTTAKMAQNALRKPPLRTPKI